MTRHYSAARFTIALLALLALARPAAAGDQVPFKGQSSGAITAVRFDRVAGIAYSRVEGEGHATHVGRFTVIGDTAVDVATTIPHGTWTITAANGDQIFMDMTGHPIDALRGLGQFTVTGGTGGFEGATGYFEQIITRAAPLGTAPVIDYAAVFEGTISSPGSN